MMADLYSEPVAALQEIHDVFKADIKANESWCGAFELVARCARRGSDLDGELGRTLPRKP